MTRCGSDNRMDNEVRPKIILFDLVPLDDAEYADFGQRHLVEYARQRVNAGEWPADGGAGAGRKELAGLLSDSLRGAGHFFFKAVDSHGERVGWLWVAPMPDLLEGPQDRKRWLTRSRWKKRGGGRVMVRRC